MSIPVALSRRDRLPPYRRVVPPLVVSVAGILSRLSPSGLRAVLEFARRRAAPATADQAAAARAAVVGVSLRCAGQACLQRSVATALLCRARGTWPTWCTGVRTNLFSAHAWVEVEGVPVGERYPAGHFRTLLAVGPADRAAPKRPQ
ncbi:lasso peptide biosynthesis B2 protein [Streptomyces sp. NBC_00859]|uniref:lasso peptide biosynthesis B2 protein n=1 Tax=Streptomyces sp. NBC_00859 TaxID=2903682 RepID=UPI00386F42EC|nr:lasso peptide biosynthesis B2 protein [Streptomyces sp. NBC_00859]